jgi:hypothetical protein
MLHLMTDARCPFCGAPLVLGGYYEVVELAAWKYRDRGRRSRHAEAAWVVGRYRPASSH